MIKTSNSNARIHVQNKEPFKGSHTFGEIIIVNNKQRYVVYSYGYHWPLFAFIDGKWYENKDRYSNTTNRQKSQLHPQCDTIKLSVECLKKLINKD